MRFTTRDLLMITTLVAAYCAMGSAGLLGSAAQIATGIAIAALLGGLVGGLLFWGSRSLEIHPGGTLIQLERVVLWRHCFFAIAGMAVVCVLGDWMFEGLGATLSYAILPCAAVTLASIRWGPTALTDEGLMVMGAVWPYEEAWLQLEPTTTGWRLRAIPKDNTKLERISIWPVVPPDRIEQVRAVLAEKKLKVEESP